MLIGHTILGNFFFKKTPKIIKSQISRALKLAQHLSKKLKCLLVHSNYSRLLCDVNRPITSETLFRKYGDANEVMLNKNMTQKEERHRLEKFYHTYYYAFREISLKTNPKIIISLHSYNPVYEGSKREVEVGVLTSFCDDLGLKVIGIYYY